MPAITVSPAGLEHVSAVAELLDEMERCSGAGSAGPVGQAKPCTYGLAPAPPRTLSVLMGESGVTNGETHPITERGGQIGGRPGPLIPQQPGEPEDVADRRARLADDDRASGLQLPVRLLQRPRARHIDKD
jgi:hypothetical protein